MRGITAFHCTLRPSFALEAARSSKSPSHLIFMLSTSVVLPPPPAPCLTTATFQENRSCFSACFPIKIENLALRCCSLFDSYFSRYALPPHTLPHKRRLTTQPQPPPLNPTLAYEGFSFWFTFSLLCCSAHSFIFFPTLWIFCAFFRWFFLRWLLLLRHHHSSSISSTSSS